MFNNTIGYNLSYGNPNASIKEIRKVVKLCNLDDFIESLDLKYETIVGERGLKLSGGEKQRVAVMRAIINNPSIIIADEPTGNLDKENAFKMMSLFQKLNTEKKLTIIVATHDEDVFNIGHKKYQLVDGSLELVH